VINGEIAAEGERAHRLRLTAVSYFWWDFCLVQLVSTFLDRALERLDSSGKELPDLLFTSEDVL